MLIACFCTALAIANCWPQTPVGKLLNYWLIEAPAQWLSEQKIARIVGALVFLIAVITIGLAFPPQLALLGALDASAFTELMVAAALLSAHLNALAVLRRLRSTARAAFFWGGSQVRAIRQDRRRHAVRAIASQRKRFKPSTTDDDGRTLAFA